VVVLIDTFTLIMFNVGVTRGEPAVVSVISSAAPLIAIVLARIFLKETISLVQKLGIFLCLLGIATLSLV
jgi:drug/metabolite transporter (DMT)-like permease